MDKIDVRRLTKIIKLQSNQKRLEYKMNTNINIKTK